MTELETVLATLHRTASAMAADARPPARIKLGAAGVTLEWDLVRVGAADHTPNAQLVPIEGGVPTPVVATVPASAAPAPAAAAGGAVSGGAAVVTAQHTLTAPTVGVFYRAPEPGAAPFVDTGDLVTAGQQVGIVEAMKLMIPVEAERGGRIVEVLCADATAVEFGAPLFALSAESAE
ncbi:acetyl-CoA carboxylase biotin carboxyl carrier protein subunit [Pseudonocardia kujensis]|uniref:acetyl-CoA carboxylase biotin carboxyl carrier protein n=1 Tax=Pseudonocardia kujensis TaxID=1128675 RepID=UPI001E60F231|nr:biotin/lipoyl-containing protein [Pseudonocardia kujensis]MCE0764875.1 acetyl-CoA carboxylase biotin carboxyl carrier protein subunit [Pseudonocardia kujensis]